MHSSLTQLYSDTPASDVEYITSTPDLAPTITLSQSDGITWAGPGWIESFTSESTVYTSSGIFEGSSQVVEIGW